MRLVSTSCSDFMSFQGLTFTFGDKGLTLIQGDNLDRGDSNGAGKTTIWDLVFWILFGQTIREIKNDAIIRRGQKSARGELIVMHKGSMYRIERHRKDKKYGNRLVFTKDGVDMELGTIAMTEESLWKELGVDFELFKRTVIFGQEDSFNFVNEKNSKQKEILSKVMNVNYESFQKIAKDKLKTHSARMDEINRKIDVLTSHVVEDTDSLFSEEIEEWDQENDSFIKTTEKRRESIRQEAMEYRSKICPHGIEQLEEEKYYAGKDIKKSSATLLALNEKALKIKVAIRSGKERIKRFTELEKEGKCPECEQEVLFEHYDIKGMVAKIKKVEEVLAKVNSKIVKEETEKNKVQNNMIELMALEKEIEDAEEKAYMYESKYDEESKKLEKLKSRVNPFLKKKKDAIDKQKGILEKIEKLEVENKELESEAPYLKFWVDAFGDSGIKSFVFDLICSTLTNKSNEYLNVLSEGSTTISFDTQKKLKSGAIREKFDCIVTTDGEQVDYKSYSGGEKVRVSLAVDMALADLMADYYGSQFNIIVFDEQTNWLDASGRRDFFKLLRKLGEKKKVYVVDHDSTFKAMFDDVITVQKKDGVSTIR